MGRVTLPEAPHVSPDVASDALFVLKPRIPAQTTVTEDPDGCPVVVVVISLRSCHGVLCGSYRYHNAEKDAPLEAPTTLHFSPRRLIVEKYSRESHWHYEGRRNWHIRGLAARAFTQRRTTQMFIFWFDLATSVVVTTTTKSLTLF